MAEYIDREAVLSAIKDYAYDCFVKDLGRKEAAAEEIGNLISKLPTSDVRPVVSGEWIGDYDGYADGFPVYDMWSCSHCGKQFDEWDERPTWSFCPNCGADMREEDTK